MAFTVNEDDKYKALQKTVEQDDSNLRNYQTYQAGTYNQSDGLKDMYNTISNWQNPTWDKANNTWWNKLTDTMNAIENREKFSYDVNGDALYQQYKDQYANQGKMAMMDTMGQAAAMTGGYGNSYAQSVGQQAYQGYLQQLTDKIPELYQMALDKYNSEGDELYNRLSSYGSLYSTEYGEHRDAVADSKDQLSHLTNLYDIKSDEEYGQWYDGEQLKMYASEQEYKKLADLLGVSTEAAKDYYDKMYKSQYDTYDTKYKEEQDKLAHDLALAQLAEEQRQYDTGLQYDATGSAKLSDGTTVTKTTTGGNGGGNGNSGDDFKQYTFARTDEDGNSVFYRDGKEYTVEKGTNPYTGTKNSDAKYGTFSNGYQPNNVGKTKINGKEVVNKLSKSGITDVVNGVTQNVWKDLNGKLWIWDGTQNAYLKYEE